MNNNIRHFLLSFSWNLFGHVDKWTHQSSFSFFNFYIFLSSYFQLMILYSLIACPKVTMSVNRNVDWWNRIPFSAFSLSNFSAGMAILTSNRCLFSFHSYAHSLLYFVESIYLKILLFVTDKGLSAHCLVTYFLLHRIIINLYSKAILQLFSLTSVSLSGNLLNNYPFTLCLITRV